MKKLFILGAISTASVLSADCANGQCGMPNYSGQGYYNAPYYNQNYPQGNQGYYQNYPQSNQGYYPANRPYQGQGYQQGGQGYYQNAPTNSRPNAPVNQPQGYYQSAPSNQTTSYSSSNWNNPNGMPNSSAPNDTANWSNPNHANSMNSMGMGSMTMDQPMTMQAYRQTNAPSGTYQGDNFQAAPNGQSQWQDSQTMQGTSGFNGYQTNTNTTQGFSAQAQKTIPDQEIAKDVHEVLAGGWFSKGYPNVSFDVNNGVVTIRGVVETLEDKTKLDESLRKVDGIRQVNNQLTVTGQKASANYQRNSNGYMADTDKMVKEKTHPQDTAATDSDKTINAKIRDKLSGGWFATGYETIIIRTANGVVTITGTVDKFEDLDKINSEIKKIDGVKSVNNQLKVKNR